MYDVSLALIRRIFKLVSTINDQKTDNYKSIVLYGRYDRNVIISLYDRTIDIVRCGAFWQNDFLHF